MKSKGIIVRGIVFICAVVCFLDMSKPEVFARTGKNSLSDAVVKAIEYLGNTEDPHYLDALLPDSIVRKENKIAISEVPSGVIDQSMYWITKVIKKEWLPEDLKSRLHALKDVKKWEKRDKKGVVFSNLIGDYILAEYEIREYQIHIQENGAILSLFVIFPDAVVVPHQVETFIKKHTETFLNLATEKIEQMTYSLQKEGNLHCGTSFVDYEENRPSVIWWQRLTLCTDGSFFFVSVSEIEGASGSRVRRGYPNRF